MQPTFPNLFFSLLLFWLACDTRTKDYPSVIGAFNLMSKKFEEVPPLDSLDKDNFVFGKLVVLEGCIGIVVDRYNGQIDVWIMKDYGVKESRTMFTVNVPKDEDIFKLICQLGEREMVSEKDGEKFVVFNLTEETLRDLAVVGIPNMFEDGVVTFSESLVPPNFYSHKQHIPDS